MFQHLCLVVGSQARRFAVDPDDDVAAVAERNGAFGIHFDRWNIFKDVAGAGACGRNGLVHGENPLVHFQFHGGTQPGNLDDFQRFGVGFQNDFTQMRLLIGQNLDHFLEGQKTKETGFYPIFAWKHVAEYENTFFVGVHHFDWFGTGALVDEHGDIVQRRFGLLIQKLTAHSACRCGFGSGKKC